MRDFPPDFIWGTSTSAYQVEGGNENTDWNDWETDPAGLTIEPAGQAIDQFNRYDEDFALLASLDHNAYRMSLEWSRIEPREGEISADAINHYRAVLESLQRHGLTAFVTLHHKTLPRWAAARGGWHAPDALKTFERYVGVVAEQLGDLIPYVCSINEPQILAYFGYLTGQMPPAVKDPARAREVNATLIEAHRSAVRIFRARPDTKIGTCLQLAPLSPARPDDEGDVEATAFLQELMTDSHVADLCAGGDVGDYVGLQYYTHAQIDTRTPSLIGAARPGYETTQMGWEVNPEGFGEMLRMLAKTPLPIIVTENGIATADDTRRIAFLQAHLEELKRAMDQGIDVRGYLYWSAFDNYEWNHGFAPRFGLVEIDRAADLRRVARPSAHAFAAVARTGQLAGLSRPG